MFESLRWFKVVTEDEMAEEREVGWGGSAVSPVGPSPPEAPVRGSAVPTSPPKFSEEASLEHSEWDWLRDLLGRRCCPLGALLPNHILGGELEGCSCLTKGSWWSLQKDPLEN